MSTVSTQSPADLFSAIADLKRRRNAVILAHYYQDPDIQDIADFIGDSLALARQAHTVVTKGTCIICHQAAPRSRRCHSRSRRASTTASSPIINAAGNVCSSVSTAPVHSV